MEMHRFRKATSLVLTHMRGALPDLAWASLWTLVITLEQHAEIHRLSRGFAVCRYPLDSLVP